MAYYKLSQSLIDKYGEKTYKLPLNVPGSCPNRDGLKSRGGCSFCAEGAMDFELLDVKRSIGEQLQKNKEYIGGRYGAKKFIAYFQNYTATYRPTRELISMMEDCLIEGVVEISLSTRPDCLPREMLEKIKGFSDEKGVQVTIELGVQCLNDQVLSHMNRGHTARESVEAMKAVKDMELGLAVHGILNYPGMDRQDVVDLAEACSEFGADRVKLHSLYIEKDTKLGFLYEEGKIEVCSFEEYLERVLLFLGHLKEDIAVERFFARAPEETSLFCNWSRSWRYLMGQVEAVMEERNFHQGQDRRKLCIM